jgi:transposase
MDEKRVTLTHKELKRLKVLQEKEAGRMTTREAAEALELSVRQVRRLERAYRERGAEGLAHDNRGKVSPRRTPEAIRKRVVELANKEYKDYNDQHFTEELADRHGIRLSRSTVRRIRRAAGQGSPRKRRAPKHRQRRERRPMEGMLLQTDGSDHDWLEGRGPRLTLVAYIDDATGEVPGAVFRDEEDAAGYLLGLRAISQTHGLPLAVYADRHSIFQSPKEATVEEQLAGKQPRSQFGRALDELEIRIIPAYSPQAKGRVERLFETLQDRLVKELRRANACTRQQANQVLVDFLPRFNQRFKKQAAQSGSAYRQWPTDLRPDEVFCFKFTRVVANDNTISFSGHKLQIPPGPNRRSFARAHVQVRQHLDAHLSVHYQAQTIATFHPADTGPLRVGNFTPDPQPQPAPPLPAPARTTSSPPAPRPRPLVKPAPDHPWRRSYKQGSRYIEK